MISIVAPPEIFSAYAFSVEPGSGELDLQPGTHLRIYAGLGSSFPLAPFVVYGVNAREASKCAVHVNDVSGSLVDPPILSRQGALDLTLLLEDSNAYKAVRVELDENAAIRSAMLLDQQGRTIAVRDKPPWTFSAPVLHKLRVWGDMGQVNVYKRTIPVNAALDLERRPLTVLGLPIEEEHYWYVGLQNHDEGMHRVKIGAPLRLNPMERPIGPFDSVTAHDEASRIEKMHEAMEMNVGIGALIERLVNDSEKPPWLQHDLKLLPSSPTGASQFAKTYRLSALQLAAVDTGMARYLGFANLIPELPDSGGNSWNTLAIVGLFAISPRDLAPFGVDLMWLLLGSAPNSGLLYDRFIDGLVQWTGLDQRKAIDDLVQRVRKEGFAVAPFVHFVQPGPPWLPPSLPQPQLIQKRWQESREGAPSNLFRSSFAFPQMQLASMSALARSENGKWITRHNWLKVEPIDRAAPGIFGHEIESNSRQDELKLKSKVQETAGLLSDYDIPADVGAVAFTARASDFFGRFGPESVFDVEPPARPIPPKPVLRFYFEREENIDLQSDALLSPGVLKVSVAVPRPWPEKLESRFSESDKKKLGSSIVVPRLDDLRPGALPLAMIAFGIGAPGPPIDVGLAGVTEFTIPAPKLKPQESKAFAFVGRYEDADGNQSDLAEQAFTITDVRPPKTYKTGVGLFWTSAPGPSPEVEIVLRWQAVQGSTYHRVYLTDQAGLGLTRADLQDVPSNSEPSRGLVAAAGCRQVINGLASDVRVFRLLTDPPLTSSGGVVTFTTRLPRSLATVQFLRIVPLGPDGAEPPFDKCGIVPVAVPESRRPPAPLIDATVDSATASAMLTITTDGFDLVALEQDEPGLFNPEKPGKEPPRAFIRRAVGAVADPIYARVIGDKAMTYVDTDKRFFAEIEDNNFERGLVPFVPYVYWAEVQLPPERRLPADVIELVGDVTPVDASAAQSHPRPKSLPSAPRVVVHAPSLPAAPKSEDVEVARTVSAAGDVALTIKIANPPVAHAEAVDDYRLAIWVQWPGREIIPIRYANGADLNGVWPKMPGGVVTTRLAVPDNADPAATLNLRLGFIDPLNRMSDLLKIDVA